MTEEFDRALIHPDHLVPGDVMLFRGGDALSRGIQMVDGGDHDHATIVGPSPDGRLWMYDVSFAGARHSPVIEYPVAARARLPEAIRVLRHRMRGGGAIIAEEAAQRVQVSSGYDLERLLFLTLCSLRSFSHKLWQNVPANGTIDQAAGAYVVGLYDMLARIGADVGVGRNKMICGDLVRMAHDVFSGDPSESTTAYYGLSLPYEPTDGLLSFSAAFRSWADYLDLGFTGRPQVNRSADEDPAVLLRALRAQFEITTLQLSYPVDVDEAKVRTSTVKAAHLVLKLLGRLDDKRVAPPADEANEAAAWYYFDQLLRMGPLVTPRTILASGSLFTVGFLDLDELRRRDAPGR